MYLHVPSYLTTYNYCTRKTDETTECLKRCLHFCWTQYISFGSATDCDAIRLLLTWARDWIETDGNIRPVKLWKCFQCKSSWTNISVSFKLVLDSCGNILIIDVLMKYDATLGYAAFAIALLIAWPIKRKRFCEYLFTQLLTALPHFFNIQFKL